MLTSLALIFLLGIMLGSIFNKIKMPNLIGFLLSGIILGPYVLNLIDNSILSISADLRKIALIIILTRAGLSIDIDSLKKVGRTAMLMCFVPALLEILGVIIFAPKLLNISIIEASIIGTVLAAVSPAVIIPRMISLKEKGYGKKNSIPEIIMAGSSIDDIFVIVLFTSFTSLATEGNLSISEFINLPISIILGLLLGGLIGIILSYLFKHVHIRDSVKVLLILSISFLLVAIEDSLKYIPFSGLLAIMSLNATILNTYENLANRLSSKFSKLWVVAEIILFVLVGATININYVISQGISPIIIILIGLAFRMIGVFLSTLKSKLSYKEKFFCMMAYSPKATVQAAIGTIPLTMGLPCGELVLTIAVLSIIITAPLGAFLIDHSYKKLLIKE
ncbi:MAG: sodium:proton antiporter [Clostridiales bacterium]|nr:sodium:proton antiporter [Clostridiales bacterium]